VKCRIYLQAFGSGIMCLV